MIYGLTSHGLDCILYVIKYAWSYFEKVKLELSFLVLHQDCWYTCYHLNARIMKFIPNEIRIMFSRFLALLGFLIMIFKTLMFDLWIFIHKIKKCFLWKIAKTIKNGCWKILKKFSYASFDWSRIPFDRLNVNFDQSKRNQESIERGRSFVMNFFIFRSIE